MPFIHSNSLNQYLIYSAIVSASITLLFNSSFTHAKIYKWRDKSGVIQYSDNLPSDATAKKLRQDTLNALQAKGLQARQSNDFCADLPTNSQKNVANYQINFFGTNTRSFNKSSNNKSSSNSFTGQSSAKSLGFSNNAGFGSNAGFSNIGNLGKPIKTPINTTLAASPSWFGLPARPNAISNPKVTNNSKNSSLSFAGLKPTAFFNIGKTSVTLFGRPFNVAGAKPAVTAPIPATIPAPETTPAQVIAPVPVITPVPAPAPVPTGKVFYIAPDGENNNDGSEAQPWRDLGHAVFMLKPGETVLVKNGTYIGTLYIDKSGEAGKPITYKAYPGHKPKIEINRKDLEGVLIFGASYINVEGFEVAYTAPGAEAAKGEQGDNGIDISNNGQILPHHITIKNNDVHGFPGGGVFSVLADYITFEGNTIWQNALWSKWGNSGISMYQNINFDKLAGYHMIVRGNTVYKNENKLPSFAIGSTTITDGNCIIIDDLRLTQKFLSNKTPYPAYQSSTLIENNVCYDNGARGIHIYSSDNVMVRNNTLYKNQRTSSINDGELTAFDASNVRFVNNIVYAAPGKKANGTFNANNITFERNLYFGASTNDNQSASDIIANPLFVNPSTNAAVANFQLIAESPAIDKALIGQSPSVDISGRARPLGIAPDLGAYESR